MNGHVRKSIPSEVVTYHTIYVHFIQVPIIFVFNLLYCLKDNALFLFNKIVIGDMFSLVSPLTLMCPLFMVDQWQISFFFCDGCMVIMPLTLL